MRGSALCLLITVGHAFAACVTSPISLPVTNVLLSNTKFKRGILASVGTPAQNVSFKIHTYLNDTWIYNTSVPFCPDTLSAVQCLTYRGGLYDSQNSTTSIPQANVSTAGGDPSDVARALGTHIWDNTWTTDNFTTSNATLESYPIGAPGFDIFPNYDPQSLLGLGRNSTLLSRLKDEEHIPSRSYSFWWGIDNPQSRSVMDGHFVFGGYDAAKVTGAPWTQPLQNASTSCQSGMTISFTNMLLDFPNGTTTDLNPTSVLTACIEPDFPAVMTIPADPFFWRFENITQTGTTGRSVGTSFWNPVYSPANVYAGDLQLQIQGGPAITIPNDVLVVPDDYYDTTGTLRTNSSSAVLRLGPLDAINVHDMPKVGIHFFSGAYLTVNHDNRTWSIWPSNPTTDSRLVTIGDDSCQQVTTATSPTEPAGTDSATSSPISKNTGMSTGAVAGIAAGCGCAALALVGLVLLMLARKRRAKRRANAAALEPPSETLSQYGGKLQDEMPWQSEIDNGVYPFNELPVARDPVEMPQNYGRHNKRGQTRANVAELPAM